jgi:hypothetical protein
MANSRSSLDRSETPDEDEAGHVIPLGPRSLEITRELRARADGEYVLFGDGAEGVIGKNQGMVLMLDWENHCDGVVAGGEVVKLRAGAPFSSKIFLREMALAK